MPRIKRPQDDGPRRSHSIWFAVVAVLCVLAAGTAKVQLWPDRRIVQQSQKQYWANVAVSASRGRIEDRNGIVAYLARPFGGRDRLSRRFLGASGESVALALI